MGCSFLPVPVRSCPWTRLCPESVATLLHGHRYDGGRATRDLGLAYTPLEESLRRALAWYAERGLVPPARHRAPD
ncbi:MAG: hypothetical protein ACKO8G_00045 [Actinomycetota bacterium]